MGLSRGGAGALLVGSLALLGAAGLLAATARRRRPAVRDAPERRPPSFPAWLKLGYGVATPIIAAAYWRTYGPRNFLWLSDVALGCTTLAVIRDSRLLASMPAVGVLPLELAWNADFLTGGRMLGLAGYMFDQGLPRRLRALSLFHVALPPTLLWMLRRFGYDARALPLQTALTWAVLPLSYAVTRPEENINRVLGPGREPQRALPPLLYLGLEMAALPLLVFLPMHLLLRRGFGAAGG